ncbi:MAG: hypothetical protein ACI8UX_002069, partial [Psychromonas sp.]
SFATHCVGVLWGRSIKINGVGISISNKKSQLTCTNISINKNLIEIELQK